MYIIHLKVTISSYDAKADDDNVINPVVGCGKPLKSLEVLFGGKWQCNKLKKPLPKVLLRQ